MSGLSQFVALPLPLCPVLARYLDMSFATKTGTGKLTFYDPERRWRPGLGFEWPHSFELPDFDPDFFMSSEITIPSISGPLYIDDFEPG